MNRPAKQHHCARGGVAELVRDVVSFGIPVYRCSGLCGTFFAVVDGEATTTAATGMSDRAGTTEMP